MKTVLNNQIKLAKSVTPSQTIDEVFLFRAMANEFNNTPISRCTYVEEIHKAQVEFPSQYKTTYSARRELGDLLLLTYNEANGELRLCVLQAKYKSKDYTKFLSCYADLFQWELLYNKPTIVNLSKKCNFPPNILNFRADYKSITAYGVFYKDNINGDTDFLYTLPDFFKPRFIPSKGSVSSGKRIFDFKCLAGLGSPNNLCKKGIKRQETISTCSIDIFEHQVLLCRVGAPINNRSIMVWTISLLKKMRNSADNSSVIDELLSHINDNNFRDDDIQIPEGHPAAMIVITDSEKYKNYRKYSLYHKRFGTYNIN